MKLLTTILSPLIPFCLAAGPELDNIWGVGFLKGGCPANLDGFQYDFYGDKDKTIDCLRTGDLGAGGEHDDWTNAELHNFDKFNKKLRLYREWAPDSSHGPCNDDQDFIMEISADGCHAMSKNEKVGRYKVLNK